MKEKKSEREVIEALLHLSELVINNIRLEIANVLCQLGWCKELIAEDGCPICHMEKEQAEKEALEKENKD